MQVYVIQDSNGEGQGIPGTPDVFTSREAADKEWERLIEEALTDLEKNWGETREDILAQLAEGREDYDPLEEGVFFVEDGYEYRWYEVETKETN